MQRGKKIPDSPRFNFVTQTAYEFLLECGYSTFPISPYDVLDELKEQVTCLAWSEARTILKSDDPFHLRKLKAEGRTVRMRDTGKYYIVYDDVTINSADRISWTIMHEIGHIILGHLVDFTETALNRGGVNNKQYGVLEVEAHYFAAEFLMPTAILKYLDGITVDEIALLFGVSDEAAKKKYKRVFEASYLPYDIYEKKLIRNFYQFIITGVDEAMYRSIYRMWGLPWKDKYVSVRRKCPECMSYISDRNAEFCPFCGALIEQRKMYRTMFQRLEEQRKFTRLPGTKHIAYPYVENDTDAFGKKFQRITVCPTCLNHQFSKGAEYCAICGQPLYNKCSVDGTIKDIEDCHCTVCGGEARAKGWFPQYEERFFKIHHYSGRHVNPNWMPYPYWEFTKWMIRGTHTKASMDLQAALLYTTAFIDDDDNVHIFADTSVAADAIRNEAGIVISYLADTDDIERTKVEVVVADDI